MSIKAKVGQIYQPSHTRLKFVITGIDKDNGIGILYNNGIGDYYQTPDFLESCKFIGDSIVETIEPMFEIKKVSKKGSKRQVKKDDSKSKKVSEKTINT